jgi:hypothetical protein
VIQVADQVVSSEGAVEAVDSELLQVLQLTSDQVGEVFAAALESFGQIKST